MSADTLEPISIYMQLFHQSSLQQFSAADKEYLAYQELVAKVQECKDSFFTAKENADRSDLKIEEAMLQFDRGELSVEQLQFISQQSTLLKYKAELASQAYGKSVAAANQFLKEDNMSTVLTKIQKLEEDRIKITQQMLAAFIQSLSNVGDNINQMSNLLAEQIQEINVDCTINRFLGLNESDAPSQLTVEPYVASQDLKKFKKELQARQFLLKQDENPAETSRKLLYQLIMESTPITVVEKQCLCESLSLPEVRLNITDFFEAFTTPRRITHSESFKTVGAVCLQMLNVLKEDHTNGLRDLHALMMLS